MNECSLVSIKDQGNFLTLAKRHLVRFQYLNLVLSKTVGSFAYGSKEIKNYTNEMDHMTKMSTTSIYAKFIKNLLLQNL